jgi:hypothetical protein
VGSYKLQVLIRDASNATVSSAISNPIQVSPTPISATFQKGVGGYTGTLDTCIKSGSPNTSFPSATTIEVIGNTTKGLIHWDLSSIPTGSTVNSAQITLNLITSDAYSIYEAKKPWVELRATWIRYDIGLNWSVAGATSPADYGSTSLRLTDGPATTTLAPAGITVLQNWISTPASNYGFVLTAPNTFKFNSSEAAVANRPKLSITYVPPFDILAD